MLKRYKNYITSSDNEDDSYDKGQISNKLINKENNYSQKEEQKDMNKLEETKKLNDNNKFNKNKEEKINIRKIVYCEICDKRLESSQDYLLHMSSKKHKYKMKELLKKELKEFGSMKKVLIKEKIILPHRRWRINNVRYLLYGFALNRYLNK